MWRVTSAFYIPSECGHTSAYIKYNTYLTRLRGQSWSKSHRGLVTYLRNICHWEKSRLPKAKKWVSLSFLCCCWLVALLPVEAQRWPLTVPQQFPQLDKIRTHFQIARCWRGLNRNLELLGWWEGIRGGTRVASVLGMAPCDAEFEGWKWDSNSNDLKPVIQFYCTTCIGMERVIKWSFQCRNGIFL